MKIIIIIIIIPIQFHPVAKGAEAFLLIYIYAQK